MTNIKSKRLLSHCLALRIIFVIAFPHVAFLYAQKKPNIIYILADDLGYGELGVMGQKKIETPNIDALARNGMLFTQHYADAVCAPSRYQLMTGLHTGHAYIRGNDEWEERGPVWNYQAMETNPSLEGQRPIPDSTITVGKLLQHAGYQTALVGKWGLGAPFTQGTPNRQGFDYFFGFICQRQDHTYYPMHLWENDSRVPLNNRLIAPDQKKLLADSAGNVDFEKYQQKDYAPDLLIKSALHFIEKNADRPFFLYYASPLPHLALQAPKKWVGYYHKKFGPEKPYVGQGYFPCEYPHATYAAMVSRLDEEVGMIVKKLKEENLYDNTLIVFSSDNGPSFHAGGADSPWFDSGNPFKSENGYGKGSLHEGGIRVPLIVQWPGKVPAGSKSNFVTANWDFLPTACDVAGIKKPDNIDGLSILSILMKKSATGNRDYLYWEYPEFGGQQAVRMGKWKGLRLNIKKSSNLRIQLFDLEKDMQEQHDVAAVHPDIVSKIAAIMQKEHRKPEVTTFEMPALEETIE